MEEHHKGFEKPIFEFGRNKLRNSRVSRNRKMKNGFRDSMSHYGLREKPKKTQKSLLVHRRKNQKSLIRCKECGKGFLYEKCLLNHCQVTHSDEYVSKSILCSFSVVHKRKRSKRVSRYKKKTTRFSVSSSSMFPVSVDDGDLLEVAESLILLSMSGGKFLNGLELFGKALDSNQREHKLVAEALVEEDGFRSNEQVKLLGISTESDGSAKKLSDFVGSKKAREDQKLVHQATAFEDSHSGNEGFEMNIEHRCGLCDKVFSTYQALGGHQTFHRIRNKSKSQTKRRDAESNQWKLGAEMNGLVTLRHKVQSVLKAV